VDWSLLAIRATRAQPPAKATTGARRDLYGAALQQFDELIEASRSAGHASRPLPLFYALSQAGRAIVAAHGSSGRVSGHGLAEDRGRQDADVLRRAVVRRRSRDDALTGLCEALGIPDPFGSPAIQPPSISIGSAWAALPRWHAYLPVWDAEWFPALRASNQIDGVDHWDRRVMDLQGLKQPPQVVDDFNPLTSRRYPQLPASSWYEPTTKSREIPRSDLYRLGTVRWEMEDDGRSVFDITRRIDNSRDRWLLPAAAGSDHEFEPITAWWVLLFAMSILARYDPALWSSALDLDRSDQAVVLGVMLDEALTAVPKLVADALLDPRDGTS
jgi:hypothetical protein